MSGSLRCPVEKGSGAAMISAVSLSFLAGSRVARSFSWRTSIRSPAVGQRFLGRSRGSSSFWRACCRFIQDDSEAFRAFIERKTGKSFQTVR